MNTPLTRNELNRIKGTGTKFNHWMGARRYKGGIKNVAAARLFLLWLSNGEKLPRFEIPAPKGTVTRHAQPKRRYDVAGIDYPEGEPTGQYVDRDQVLTELEELKAEDDAIKLAQRQQREKAEARVIRKKRAKREAKRNGQ